MWLLVALGVVNMTKVIFCKSQYYTYLHPLTSMTTTLQFQTILELIDFQMVATAQPLKINTLKLTLTGNFSEADIELAKVAYNAQLFSSK
jgi:hypothetical protein